MTKKILGLAGIVMISTQLSAQKANETSAAVEYKKFSDNLAMMMMGGGDMEAAKKAIEKAKTYIDLAAAHETTKESPKTLFYKGEIYTGYIMAFATDTVFMKENGENYLNTGLESYKKSYTSSTKFQKDIESSINQKKAMFGMGINMLYDQKKYKEAGEAYEMQVRFSDAMNQTDSLSLFNAGICYEKAEDHENTAKMYAQCAKVGYKAPQIYAMASSALRKVGKLEDAKKMLNDARVKYPSDKAILLEIVNISIEAGDAAAAEASLNEAISKDPKNKQLWYTIGTIYIDLKQDEKAEQALNKALEIDPNYVDAQYQLGAFLVGVAANYKDQASALKFGDPKYDALLAQSDEAYKRALIPLEKYIEKEPKDKAVLTILFQIHKSLKNTEKALEYKKRADAL